MVFRFEYQEPTVQAGPYDTGAFLHTLICTRSQPISYLLLASRACSQRRLSNGIKLPALPSQLCYVLCFGATVITCAWSLSLAILGWVLLAVNGRLGIAGTPLALGDRVHNHWNMLATSPPRGILCRYVRMRETSSPESRVGEEADLLLTKILSFQSRRTSRNGKDSRQVSQVCFLHMAANFDPRVYRS